MFGNEYSAPENVDEVIDILANHTQAKIIAGGTDLLVQMRHRALEPELIVDVRRLPFNAIVADHEKITIGSGVSHTQIVNSDVLRQYFPILVQASKLVGGPSIRNRATLGGNLVNASPAADSIPPLLAHDAEVVIVGKNGSRTLPLNDFYTGYRQTQLAADELLQSIKIPLPAVASATHFIKYGNRRSLHIAVLNIAINIGVSAAGVVEHARIALGCVGPTVFLAKSAEAVLQGKQLDQQSIAAAARLTQEEATPISDMRASADYRSKMVAVLVRRALTEVAAQLVERS